MGVSFEGFVAELKAFDNKKVIINEIRKEFRKPALLGNLRKEVRANALSTLPTSGGLGAWVAKSALSVRFKDVGRAAGLRVKMGRKSGKGKADLDALDRSGQIRHPLYGNRRHWYSQAVASRFFTSVWDQYADEWIKAADDAFDRALEVIRRG